MSAPSKLSKNTFDDGFFTAIAIGVILFCLFTAMILIGIF